jgi:hypothetical protein
MKTWLKVLISVLVVLIIGGGIGFGVTYSIGSIVYDANAIHNGPWGTNLLQGSTVQDPYTRYIIAVRAVMALPREETIYYGAVTSDKGEELLSQDDYAIAGKNIDTRWWSITVYDEGGWLIPNQFDRYSYNVNTVKFDADGTFTIHVSRTPKEGNWLPVGSSKKFQLLLRCYNPGPDFYKMPDKVELPHIMKEASK